MLRAGVILVRYDELNSDPDSYIGIAQNIAAGRGYSIPDSTKATAFRPPLYPLLIAPISSTNLAWARGLLNLLAAAGSIVLIYRAAAHLGLAKSGQLAATLIYGCDPLLIRYASYSMTETVCSFVSALLLWQLSRPIKSSKDHLLTGVVFGLCVLTRPTFWALGILYALVLTGRTFFQQSGGIKPLLVNLSLSLIGTTVVVSPWFIRNIAAQGEPVLMTTHGGYTILLGNNEAFYREVVDQPFGTVWDGTTGPGQAAWADEINNKMDELGLASEVERDRWMAQQAKQTIRDNPVTFLRASLLRFIRFWNITPSGPAASNIPGLALYLVAFWYTAIWLMLLAAVVLLVCNKSYQDQRWLAVGLLVVSFTLVHLVYWSNVRMRAPIVPAIALLAASSYGTGRIKECTSLDTSESLQIT